MAVLQTAITALRTILPKPSRFTLLVTPLSGPAGRASTLTINWITNTIVRTVASFGAILSVMLCVARAITTNSLPPRGTETLTCLRGTRGTIHAFTRLAAILTIGSITALFFAALSIVTSNAITSSVDMIAWRVVLAVTVNKAVLSISQERTWSVAKHTTPTRIAEALSSPWMA